MMDIYDSCICGRPIPMGYGYYNYGKPIKCLACGRVNEKESEILKYANSQLNEEGEK